MKHCYSDKCQQQYFIVFVRNRLIISKKCEEKYEINQLYLSLATNIHIFATKKDI